MVTVPVDDICSPDASGGNGGPALAKALFFTEISIQIRADRRTGHPASGRILV